MYKSMIIGTPLRNETYTANICESTGTLFFLISAIPSPSSQPITAEANAISRVIGMAPKSLGIDSAINLKLIIIRSSSFPIFLACRLSPALCIYLLYKLGKFFQYKAYCPEYKACRNVYLKSVSSIACRAKCSCFSKNIYDTYCKCK